MNEVVGENNNNTNNYVTLGLTSGGQTLSRRKLYSFLPLLYHSTQMVHIQPLPIEVTHAGAYEKLG